MPYLITPSTAPPRYGSPIVLAHFRSTLIATIEEPIQGPFQE
jgi:hypothetical protein